MKVKLMEYNNNYEFIQCRIYNNSNAQRNITGSSGANNNNARFLLIYRQPSAQIQVFTEWFYDQLQPLVMQPGHILILGDFNLLNNQQLNNILDCHGCIYIFI